MSSDACLIAGIHRCGRCDDEVPDASTWQARAELAEEKLTTANAEIATLNSTVNSWIDGWIAMSHALGDEKGELKGEVRIEFVRNMRAMLKKLEFCGQYDGNDGYCPSCRGFGASEGLDESTAERFLASHEEGVHRADCKLQALLTGKVQS